MRHLGRIGLFAATIRRFLVNLRRQQCVVSTEDDAAGPQVSIKEPKDICSDSLQGPADPDATYSGHKGKGYTGQFMESFDPAHVSDVHATLPAITAVQERGLGPQQVLADTLWRTHSDSRTSRSTSRAASFAALRDAPRFRHRVRGKKSRHISPTRLVAPVRCNCAVRAAFDAVFSLFQVSTSPVEPRTVDKWPVFGV